jgi:hypothetical protein
VAAVAKAEGGAARELEIGLVNQASGVEGLTSRATADVSAGQAPQLVVHERDHTVEGGSVARVVGPEKQGDLADLHRPFKPPGGGAADPIGRASTLSANRDDDLPGTLGRR